MAKQTQSALIRAFLIEQGRPCTVVDIWKGISPQKDRDVFAGLPHTAEEAVAAERRRVRLYQNVHRMWREKVLHREGVVRKYQFTVARDPSIRKRMPADEATRLHRERIRKAYFRRLGRDARTREQYLQDCAARKQARLASQAAAKAERKAARDLERAEREAAREAARAAKAKQAKPKPAPKPRPVDQRPSVAKRARKPAPAIQRAPNLETVEQWMARTGKQPERIAPGVVSQPLRHIREAA